MEHADFMRLADDGCPLLPEHLDVELLVLQWDEETLNAPPRSYMVRVDFLPGPKFKPSTMVVLSNG